MTAIPNLAKQNIVSRLSRIEGQIRGVTRLVEGDHECDKVLQQLSAARKALDKAFVQIIAEMLNHCAADAKQTQAKQKTRISEMVDLLAKYG